MPKKRVKSKQKLTINYNNLTEELYEAICKDVSMFEHLGDYKHLGFEYGQYFTMFNKNNPKVCKEIWNLHKDEVMARWKNEPGRAGTRPFLWWTVEAPEPRIKITRVEKYNIDRYSKTAFYCPGGDHEIVKEKLESEREYLTRLNLLEPWEVAELEKDKSIPVEE